MIAGLHRRQLRSGDLPYTHRLGRSGVSRPHRQVEETIHRVAGGMQRPQHTTEAALARAAACALMMVLLAPLPGNAQDSATEVGTDIGTLYKDQVAPLYRAPGYSPYAGRNFPTRVLWGDTHLHTANSLDAAAFGNSLGPEPAYRFARGEEVVSSSGQPVKLSRPLGFLGVADHAEGLASTDQIRKGNPTLVVDPRRRP